MAKLAYSKLNLKQNKEIKTIKYNDLDIEIIQYLPINDKLELIGNVINYSADDNNFSNPIKLDVFTSLEIVFKYTNISFTDKQKEDLVKLFDILESNGFFDLIISNIPSEEYNAIVEGVKECSDAIYTYRNSALGIVDAMQKDYNSLNLDATEIEKKLTNSENLEFLKEVMAKMA